MVILQNVLTYIFDLFPSYTTQISKSLHELLGYNQENVRGNERRERASMLMNRMKSISLADLNDDGDEQWYPESNQEPPQREISANSGWRRASKHFLRGTYYRGQRNYNRNVEMATDASRTGNQPNPANTSLVDTDSSQRGAGGTGGHITYSHDLPQQQESRRAFTPPSSASSIYRSCMF